MRMKELVAGTVLAVLLGGGAVLAQKPKDNVSEKRHPNLAAAQRLSTQAYEKIIAAQKANEWDMRGHAQKAKDLLEQVNQVNNELKQAAEAANRDAK
jgi:gas vesicle protein